MAAIRARLVNDTRDSVSWPTEGLRRSIALELGHADGTLAKLTANWSGYVQILENLIFAFEAYGGVMPVDAEDIGIGERFFLGGTEDLRGFAFRGAGPMDEGDDDVAIGGSTKLVIQNELRFTLVDGGPGSTALRGLVFGDFGLIGRDPLDCESARASVGAGLRIDMRHVNIGFDFAAPVLYESSDDRQFFHFKVSPPF